MKIMLNNIKYRKLIIRIFKIIFTKSIDTVNH